MTSKKEIQEIINRLDMPEEEIKKILDDVSKPSLTNTHCTFNNELGVGPSDKAT